VSGIFVLKNYQNLIFVFQVTVENVGMFWDTVYMHSCRYLLNVNVCIFAHVRSFVDDPIPMLLYSTFRLLNVLFFLYTRCVVICTCA